MSKLINQTIRDGIANGTIDGMRFVFDYEYRDKCIDMAIEAIALTLK